MSLGVGFLENLQDTPVNHTQTCFPSYPQRRRRGIATKEEGVDLDMALKIYKKDN
ncbi:hypothetical protein Hdeb2414_s0021g00569761 [Helianthus debilis subsp. tardiflorus]